FSFNSPRGWCPTCRGHGRVFPWMIEFADEEDQDDPARRLREFGVDSADDLADDGEPCPECRGARLNRVGRAVMLHFKKKLKAEGKLTRGKKSRFGLQLSAFSLSLPQLLAST